MLAPHRNAARDDCAPRPASTRPKILTGERQLADRGKVPARQLGGEKSSLETLGMRRCHGVLFAGLGAARSNDPCRRSFASI